MTRLWQRPFSLRLRLIALVLTVVTGIWLSSAFFTWSEAKHELDELLDAHLAQTAALLLAQSVHELGEDESIAASEAQSAPLLHRYARKLAFQIRRADGTILLASANAPAVAMGDSTAGFDDIQLDGEHWRVFSAWDDAQQVLVHVGEHHEARSDVTNELIEHLLQPLLFALPLLALLLAFAVRRALLPLDSLARDLAGRAPDNLAPLNDGQIPAEVAPLVSRLNALFAGIDRAMENERRFTADAAHELRTPLAALKAHAQVAEAARDDAERRHALQQIIQGGDRATHLVEQLLTLARLDARSREQFQTLALRPIAAEVLASHAGLAIELGFDLDLGEGDAEATVRGDNVLLQVLLRNLVENALHHSQGSRIEVTIAQQGEQVMLRISDNGIGIAPDKRQLVQQRFYRIPGAHPTGSGLGLSIVARIVELHGASLTLTTPATGTGNCVEVVFP